MLKHGILGLLSYGDMTGYEIMLTFRDSLSHFWSAQTSQIYRELQALEKSGWLTLTHVAQEGRPDKNILSITPEGRAELARWVRSSSSKTALRNPMMMKTFFRGECSIEENIAYFKALPESESVLPHGGEAPAAAIAQYGKIIDEPLKALYWRFTVDFGVMYDKMLRQWCRHCIEELEGLRLENTVD